MNDSYSQFIKFKFLNIPIVRYVYMYFSVVENNKTALL